MSENPPLDLDAQPSNDLAADLERALDVLADELDDDELDGPDAGMAGLMPAGMALDLIKSLATKWASDSPDEVLAVLTRAHLETGALIDEHTDVDVGEPSDALLDLLDA